MVATFAGRCFTGSTVCLICMSVLSWGLQLVVFCFAAVAGRGYNDEGAHHESGTEDDGNCNGGNDAIDVASVLDSFHAYTCRLTPNSRPLNTETSKSPNPKCPKSQKSKHQTPGPQRNFTL